VPYSTPFVKVNVLGHFGINGATATERWQTGFHVANIGGISTSPASLLTFLTAIDPFIATFHSHVNLWASSNSFYDGLNAALIGVDGKYALGSLQPTTIFTRGTPSPGAGTCVNPWATAMVLSLRSAILRGPASHGRMYWPQLGTLVTPGLGTWPSSVQNAMATAGQTMFNSINTACATAFGTGSNVSLVSNIGFGSQSPVINVGVGAKPDHMESRERTLQELHVFKPLTLAASVLAERDAEILRRLDELVED
jgi:hypothetical protein